MVECLCAFAHEPLYFDYWRASETIHRISVIFCGTLICRVTVGFQALLIYFQMNGIHIHFLPSSEWIVVNCFFKSSSFFRCFMSFLHTISDEIRRRCKVCSSLCSYQQFTEKAVDLNLRSFVCLSLNCPSSDVWHLSNFSFTSFCRVRRGNLIGNKTVEIDNF